MNSKNAKRVINKFETMEQLANYLNYNQDSEDFWYEVKVNGQHVMHEAISNFRIEYGLEHVVCILKENNNFEYIVRGYLNRCEARCFDRIALQEAATDYADYLKEEAVDFETFINTECGEQVFYDYNILKVLNNGR